MKSGKDLRPHLAVPKTEFMKASSFNFLENERNAISGHKIVDENCTAKNVDTPNKLVEESNTTTLLKRTEETLVTSETKNEEGVHAPKKYVTKCYFQPKQNPVSYSETVILTLGSKKKHYFDTILYQTKLIPFRWIESMTTVTPPITAYEFKSSHECFIEGSKFDYISLESQQLAAQEKSNRNQEIQV